MKRRLLTLAIFLLLGAVVNVAVVWGFVILVGRSLSPGTAIPESYGPFRIGYANRYRWDESQWVVAIWKQPGWVRVLTRRPPQPLLPDDYALSPNDWYVVSMLTEHSYHQMEFSTLPIPHWSRAANREINAGGPFYLIEDGHGWPLLSMMSEFQVDRSGNVVFPHNRCGIQVRAVTAKVSGTLSDWSTPRVLPLRPIWPAFAINTLFYAAILWPVILGPFALRRHIRRKRGQCVACGYDLSHADHNACPECGCRREAVCGDTTNIECGR